MRRAVAWAAALAAVAVTAAPAWAADSLSIVTVDDTRYPTTAVTVSAPSVKPGSQPVFEVAENGQPVPGVRVVSGSTGAAIALVLDGSHTMRGKPITEAVEAASAFASAKRPADQMAVFTFGKTVQTLLALTTDTATIISGLGQISIEAAPGTALFDGIVAGSRHLASVEGRRVLVVMADGQDNASTASASLAKTTARGAGVTVYAIALKGTAFNPKTLESLATATGGKLYEANRNADSIRGVYAQIDKDVRTTFRLEYPSTATAAPIKLEVGLEGGTAAKAAYSPAGIAPPQTTKTSAGAVAELSASPFAQIGLAIGAGVLMLFAVLVAIRPKPETVVAKRIDLYTSAGQQKAQSQREPGMGLAKQLMIATERVFGHLKFWQKMAFTIEQADLPIRTAELAYIMGGAALLGGIVFAGLLHIGIFTLVLMPICGLIPYFFVRFKAKKRRKVFEAQLGDTMVAVASSLRAGHSFAQAIATIVKDGEGPAAKEFQRVESETRLGRSSESALDAMAKRLSSKNFEFVVLAVNIQRQVGGSLADILDMVADTVREREQFHRKIHALTSMGRASAWVLILLPFFLAGAIRLMNGAYLRPLYTTSTGHIMILIGLGSMSIGCLLIRKIVNFKY